MRRLLSLPAVLALALFGTGPDASAAPAVVETSLGSALIGGGEVRMEQTHPASVLVEVTSQGGATFDHAEVNGGADSPLRMQFEATCGDGYDGATEQLGQGELVELRLDLTPLVASPLGRRSLASWGTSHQFGGLLSSSGWLFGAPVLGQTLAGLATDACRERLVAAGGEKAAYSMGEFNAAAGTTTLPYTAVFRAICRHEKNALYHDEHGQPAWNVLDEEIETKTLPLDVAGKIQCISPHAPGALGFTPQPAWSAQDLQQVVAVEQAQLFAVPQAPPDGSACGLQINGQIQTNVATTVEFHLESDQGAKTASQSNATSGPDHIVQFQAYLDFSKSGDGVWVGTSGQWALPGSRAAQLLGSQAGPHQGSWRIVCDSPACTSTAASFDFSCAEAGGIGEIQNPVVPGHPVRPSRPTRPSSPVAVPQRSRTPGFSTPQRTDGPVADPVPTRPSPPNTSPRCDGGTWQGKICVCPRGWTRHPAKATSKNEDARCVAPRR